MKKGWITLLCTTAVFLCVFILLFACRNLIRSSPTILDTATSATAESDPYYGGKININTAGVSELILLPGIGEGIAKNIIAYRNENGPYAATEDILNVKGIGPGRYDEIEPYITVGG